MGKRASPRISVDSGGAPTHGARSEQPAWLKADGSVLAAIADGTAFQDTVRIEPEVETILRTARTLMNEAVAEFNGAHELEHQLRSRMAAQQRRFEAAMLSPHLRRSNLGADARVVEAMVETALAWTEAAEAWLRIDRKMNKIRRRILTAHRQAHLAERALARGRHFKAER